MVKNPNKIDISDKADDDTFDTIPLYMDIELDKRERIRLNLATNQYLQKEWKKFVYTYYDSPQTPANLSDPADFHFYMSKCRLIPEQSPGNRLTFVNKMALGPDFDIKGRIPLPSDICYRRPHNACIEKKVKKKPVPPKNNKPKPFVRQCSKKNNLII